MKKVFTMMMIAAVLVTGLMLTSCNVGGPSGELIEGLGYFSSREEIINRIDAYAAMYNNNNGNWFSNLFRSKSIVDEALDMAPEATMGGSNDAADSYTRTNTQVEGIDEGDIIKADENNIYVLSQAGFYIVEANDGELQKSAEIKLENYVPQEMYVEGNQLILIGGVYNPNKEYPMYDIAIEPACCWYPYTDQTDIRIYDISDNTAPILSRQITLSGNYNTSRLTNGTLYYVINYNFYYGEKDTYIPKISDSAVEGGAEKEIAPSDINFFDGIPNYNYMITGKISLSDTSSSLLKAYLGIGGTIYVSANNIYAISEDYSNRVTTDGNSSTYDLSKKTSTRIVRIALEDLQYTGKGNVEGQIKDRYSLDEYDGYLRVATTTSYYDNEFRQYSNVFVLDGELNTIATITDIAPGESIYSVRFRETEGTLVTFKQVDPLFKLDFTDPLHPTISEGLKKDGVSMYLHYIDGTDYIIGLGRDTEENQWGGVTWKGLEVVLFDNSGEEAEIINTVYIGNACSYTEALYNPKAILYDQNLNIFAFAAESWVYSNNGNYSQNAQGYYVFGIEDGRLVQRAMLTDIDEAIQYNDWYSYYNYNFSYIKRGARIGNYLYTISDRYVTSYALADFAETDKLKLAEFQITENGINIGAAVAK